MVTNKLQRNVYSAGFMVNLVETTDMQHLCAFTLAVCVVVAVVAQCFSKRVPDLTALTFGDWVSWSFETCDVSCSIYRVYNGPNEAFVGSILCEI